MPHVVVVGGGIAGLSTAWYLQRASPDVTYALLEQSGRWGGKIRTERIDGYGDAPFVIEGGPDSFLTRKPWALELARELGLGERLISTNAWAPSTFVLRNGRALPLPDGLTLLAPARLWPFLRSPLFSWRGKLRVLREPLIPARRDDDDESLAAFVERRLGREMLDKLGEPLLSGIFNTDPERQSVLATLPNLRLMETTHGSLVRGFRALARRPPAAGASPFMSLRTGMDEIVSALTQRLTGDLRLSAGVTRIVRDHGGSYTVTPRGGASLRADAVVVATQADTAATLLADVAPDAARRVREIRYAGRGVIALAYRRDDIPHPLNGFGILIPRTEARRIDAMSWTSSKWAHRAPSGHASLRVFFGGPNTRGMLERDDEELTSIVRREVADLLGIQVRPLFSRIHRWPHSDPQYEVGHLTRVAAIRADLPPNLFVTGSAYEGVGIPDCVHQGRETAGALVETLAAARPN